ncbi:MAG: Hsp20/alpha crystallin family protein [Methylacidiphilales bacterium]|nr:Hsp20/alpha crystallin family protein [Candidatus Methylacidiphilales bacterium]
MTNITNYNRNLISDFFNDTQSFGYFIRPLHGDTNPESFKIDVQENNYAFFINAELPGVNKEDVHITVEDRTVSIRTEVKQHDQQTENNKVVRSERYFGTYQRTFSLPSSVDSASSTANYKNGILSITLNKKIKETQKRIEVK